MKTSLKLTSLLSMTVLSVVTTTGCNPNTASSPGGNVSASSSTPLDQFLVPGNVAKYAGTETVQITFANPTANEPNSFASYLTSETDTVSAAPASSSAAFVVHKEVTYSTIQAPAYGSELLSAVTDQYENIVASESSNSISVVVLQSVSTTSATNITDSLAAPSGAPYSTSTSSTTTYTNPAQVKALPLIAGNSWNGTLARTAVTSTNTTDSSNNTYASSNLTTIYESDDSYIQSGQNSLTSSTSRTLSSDGSALVTNTNSATSAVTLVETIRVPQPSGSGFIIPVSLTNPSKAVVQNYGAADWYPGGQNASSPLGTQTYTVIGPATSLPSGCTYQGVLPNTVEYVVKSTNVDPINATSTVTENQVFDSNGTTVCSLSQTTTNVYSLKTGAIVRTQVTTVTNSLEN